MKIKVTGKLLTNVVVMPFESHAMFAPSILVFSFMPVQWHLVCEEFVSLLYNYSLLITIIINSHCYYIRFVVKYVLVCSNKWVQLTMKVFHCSSLLSRTNS